MISERLKQVLLQELELSDFDITGQTKANEVPGWDSLKHLGILAAVEKAYQIRFRSLEVMRLKNIGELQALVDKKAKAAA
jgi:acyl carrier protein